MADLSKLIAERERTRDERRERVLYEGGLDDRNWFMFSEDPGVTRAHKERDLFDFVDAMILDTLKALRDGDEVAEGFAKLDKMREQFREE